MSTKLNVKDLEIGTEVAIIRYYNFGSSNVQEGYKVSRILKTKVVVERELADGRTATREFKVVNSTWSDNGDIANEIGGGRLDITHLVRTDSEQLKRAKADGKRQELESAARIAAERFVKGYHTVEDAKAAIQALQVFIEAKEG